MQTTKKPSKTANHVITALVMVLLATGFIAIIAPKVFATSPSSQTTVCLMNGVYSCSVTFHSGVTQNDFLIVSSSANWFLNTPADGQDCPQNLGSYSYSSNGTSSFPTGWSVSQTQLVSGNHHATGGFNGGPYDGQCGVSYQTSVQVTQAGTHGITVTYGQAWTENNNNYGSVNVYDVTGCANISCAYSTVGLNNTNIITTTSTKVVNTIEGNPQGGNDTFHYTGGNSGSGVTTHSNEMDFYQSQNTGSTGLIDNVTIKVGAVHINATTGALYLAIYAQSAVPTPAAPYSLVGNPLLQTVYNGTTTPYFIKWNPQAYICSGCWYAVVLMPVTFHSNSNTVKGSGIKVEEVSQPTENEYNFTTNAHSPPKFFFSNTLKVAPYDWIYWHLSYTVAVVTATSTFVTGASTVTSTTTINQAGVQANSNAYIAIAIIATLFLLGAKFGGIAGAIFGAVIAEIACIMGGFITGTFATVALVVTVVASLAMVYLGRSSGTGGGI